jgi:hypothetical protein
LSANKNLNLNRYVRLMALASTDLPLTMPMGIWVLWVNVRVVGLSSESVDLLGRYAQQLFKGGAGPRDLLARGPV